MLTARLPPRHAAAGGWGRQDNPPKSLHTTIHQPLRPPEGPPVPDTFVLECHGHPAINQPRPPVLSQRRAKNVPAQSFRSRAGAARAHHGRPPRSGPSTRSPAGPRRRRARDVRPRGAKQSASPHATRAMRGVHIESENSANSRHSSKSISKPGCGRRSPPPRRSFRGLRTAPIGAVRVGGTGGGRARDPSTSCADRRPTLDCRGGCNGPQWQGDGRALRAPRRLR